MTESIISHGKQDEADVCLPGSSESSVAKGQEAAARLPQWFPRGRAIEYLDLTQGSIRLLVPSEGKEMLLDGAVLGCRTPPEALKWLAGSSDKIQGPNACDQVPHSP